MQIWKKGIIYNLPEYFTVFHSILLRIVYCVFDKFVEYVTLFFVCLLFREVLQFYLSLMSVNLNQYRGPVGVFSNHNLPTRKTYVFSSKLLQ